MKVINYLEESDKRAPATPLDTVLSSLKLSRSWDQDEDAQDWVVDTLATILDNSFVMLRNVTLEGAEVPVPLILVGPPGVHVIYPSALRGIYRAKGDIWEQMDDHQQLFKPVLPNLIARTLLMRRAVETHFSSKEYPLVAIEPVLVFSDPGTHVEAIRPDVRVVMADGLERFCAGLLQSSTQLDREAVQKIVNMMSLPSSEAEQTASPYPERDSFSFADENVEKKLPTIQVRLPDDQPVVTFLNKIPFTTRQWVVLAVMAIFNIIILIGFVLYILMTS